MGKSKLDGNNRQNFIIYTVHIPRLHLQHFPNPKPNHEPSLSGQRYCLREQPHFIERQIFKMAVELRRNQHKRKKDSNNNKNPAKKKSKKSIELKDLTLKEIDRLNGEICHLEEEIFQKEASCAAGYSFETLQRIGTELLDSNRSSDLPGSSHGNDRSELEKDIDVLNSRISSLESFAGIRFVENNVSVLSKTNSTTVILRRMSGTCQRISFAVEFEVKEDEKIESAPSPENEGK